MIADIADQLVHSEQKPAESPLCVDARYSAKFPYLPLREIEVRVELDPSLASHFDAAKDTDTYGLDDESAARDLVMTWVGTKVDW